MLGVIYGDFPPVTEQELKQIYKELNHLLSDATLEGMKMAIIDIENYGIPDDTHNYTETYLFTHSENDMNTKIELIRASAFMAYLKGELKFEDAINYAAALRHEVSKRIMADFGTKGIFASLFPMKIKVS